MDFRLLAQSSQKQRGETYYPRKEGFLIDLVMRLSGGKITTLKGATVILIVVTVVCFVLSLYLIVHSRLQFTQQEKSGIESHY